MAFNNFKSIGAVAQAYKLRTRNENTIIPSPTAIAPSAEFLKRLDFVLRQELHKSSEAARCETLIYPILLEVWQHFAETLKLWSHTPIEYDATLTGVPDYLVAAQSEFGPSVLGKPILVAIEAKQDDFVLGWGQCAAEMVAIQKLNADAPYSIFGIVTNGEVWQFGKLESQSLTQEMTYYGLADLPKLFGVLSFVVEECAKQVTTIHLENN
jgi:hypothetical protein